MTNRITDPSFPSPLSGIICRGSRAVFLLSHPAINDSCFIGRGDRREESREGKDARVEGVKCNLTRLPFLPSCPFLSSRVYVILRGRGSRPHRQSIGHASRFDGERRKERIGSGRCREPVRFHPIVLDYSSLENGPQETYQGLSTSRARTRRQRRVRCVA